MDHISIKKYNKTEPERILRQKVRNSMKYILCDEKGNEVKVGNDYDFADFVNAVYANDGWFFLDEKGNIVEC